LIGILLRCCSEKKRARAPAVFTINQDLLSLEKSNHPELRLQLQIAIDRLPDGQRHVLLLHDVEGYTHEEIASLLGIQAGTSKSQLSHARKQLRSYLEDGRR
jgi:RNA polymerase sigma factor (sigma-70 family)